ncbi:AsmA family protein [Phreatobacter aquaticus]|uniref:AsmA family protein n=1 Tax=Phreatobacter aquaticus TaxID=2570229 RepID=A0A4D7QHA7_9HYPH|nr:AsmA family protein [Phreatobacter aquaticus]QCK84816.1 AsmA family protein [Phreatobacter aquaticus]
MTIVGAAAVLLACVLALVPLIVPSESVRRIVVQELGQRLGVPVTVSGSVSISILPQLAVHLETIRIGAPDRPALATGDSVVGALRLLPLLTGQVSISDYVLVRPRIAIQVAGDGRSNWDAALDAVRQVSLQNRSGVPDFRIVDGEAAIVDEKTQQRIDLSAIELAVAWPGFERQANISGRFVLRGEATEISAIVARPLALLGGESSGLKMRFASAPLRGGFDGEVSSGDGTTASGLMTLDGPSLRTFLRWIGQNPGIGPALGSFALKGEVRISPNALAFSKVNAELDGNVADGALTVTLGGERPQVQGTLDAGRVNATPYFADLDVAPDHSRGWSRRPIDLSPIIASDLDLRLSAREVVIGSATFGRSAAAVVARNGRLTLTVGEAQAYGGDLRGALVIQPHASGFEARASLTVQRAQLGQGLGAWFGFRRLEGTANIQVALEARGAHMADFARTASGQATVSAVEGAVHGFNAEAILRRLERRPLASTGADARSGRTPYDRVAATLRIVNGVASTEDLVLDGPIIRVSMGGAIQLPARELDMHGIAMLKRSTREGNFELPFVVQGNWEDPFALPDPQSLIRRSGAAAPLRDVTRDRDALRAVLDAINRQGNQEAASEASPPVSSFAPFPAISKPGGN